MATNRTFTMIKPEAVENGHIGAILERINAAGFKIVAMKKTALSAEKAGEFYACLLYTSPSPRDVEESRMPSSA